MTVENEIEVHCGLCQLPPEFRDLKISSILQSLDENYQNCDMSQSGK